MSILVIQGEGWEDGGITVMARVVDNDGENVLQADVTSISRTVFNLAVSKTVPVSVATAIVVADSVFDTLQTDDRWTEDATGYNFLDTIPASVFATGGCTYRAEYEFTPTTGEVYWVVANLWVEPLLTS